MRRYKVTVTTDASGDATAYSPRVSGVIHSVRYVKNNYDDGIDVTITAEATGEAILAKSDVNASASFYPRAATHSTAGAAALYASGGLAVNDKVALASDRIKIVVAQGGNAKSGAFHFLVG